MGMFCRYGRQVVRLEAKAERLLGGERDRAHVAAGAAAADRFAVEVVDQERPLHVARQARPAGERGGHQAGVVVPAEAGQLERLLHASRGSRVGGATQPAARSPPPGGRRDAARRADPPPRPAGRAERVPSGSARSGSSSSSGSSTKRRLVTSGWGSVSRSERCSRSPSSSTSTSIGRGRGVRPPGARPSSRSTCLQASSSASGLEVGLDPDAGVEEVGLVGHLALRRGLVDRRATAVTSSPRPSSAARAARRVASRSPSFEPRPR